MFVSAHIEHIKTPLFFMLQLYALHKESFWQFKSGLNWPLRWIRDHVDLIQLQLEKKGCFAV